jgi:molybdenum cofactor cytidylyltransferase
VYRRFEREIWRAILVIAGIVLAAGASSRMGQPKAALTLGQSGETVVARVVRTLLDGGVPKVAVVAGAHIDAVRAAMPALEARARLIEHQGWRHGQLSSLLAGLDAIDDPLLEAALVTLVDVPLVRASTVAEIIAAWRRTHAPIVRPADASTALSASPQASGPALEASAERHGHPVIFDRSVFGDLRGADRNTGAKAVFTIHRARIVNVSIDDPGAFEDIDTPEDYERVVSRES